MLCNMRSRKRSKKRFFFQTIDSLTNKSLKPFKNKINQ